MCTICSLTQTFDPTRHSSADLGETVIYADVLESQFGTDVLNTITTTATMSVGDTFRGALNTLGDEDWIAVHLTADTTYTIALNGLTLGDPYLEVFDPTGALVKSNDNGGAGTDALMNLKAATTGSYFIGAKTFEGLEAGTYTLDVAVRTPPPVGTLDELAAFLTSGYWDRDAKAFNTTASNQITVNITALTPDGQQLARWAFEAWEMVANLDFVETTGAALITFDDNQQGAFANFQWTGAYLTTATVNVGVDWQAQYGVGIESYTFSTYMHEIGHALGLGHLGAYNQQATYGVDETFANDSWQLSIMSYFDQAENTTITADRADLMTPMMADIVAIQSLYGAPNGGSVTAGNTVWARGSNLDNYIGEVFDDLAGIQDSPDFNPVTAVAFTIYDRDGFDTIDVSDSTDNDRWDLRPETFSDSGGFLGNFAIARGTIIEALTAGTGDDHITGNSAANVLDGGAGHDTLIGGVGADSLDGGDNTDTADYSASPGAVIMAPGGGITGGHATGDTLVSIENIIGSLFSDTLRGDGGVNQLDGGGGNDILVGGAAADILNGGAGSDTLIGGAGADVQDGGNNSDTYLVGNGDMLSDTGTVGYDRAQIASAAGDTLDISGWSGINRVNGNAGDDRIDGASATQNLVLDGAGNNDTLIGGSGHDVMLGGEGADSLIGGGGNDTMLGGTGDDIFEGGGGNDLFFIGESGDVITDAGIGTDKAVISDAAGLTINVSSWLGLERLNGFTGGDNITATGSNEAMVFATAGGADTVLGGNGNDTVYAGTGADEVSGSAGDDALIGAAGNDTLNGGADNDFLLGGADADTFAFDNNFGRDVVRDYVDETDMISFQGHSGVNNIADLSINEVGANTIVTLTAGGTDQITIVGINHNLESTDFLF